MNSLLSVNLFNFFNGRLGRSRVVPIIAGTLWIIVVALGMWSSMAFDTTRGESGVTPSRWPSGSHIAFQAGRINLIMLAHPNCPCTRASLAELGEIMARSNGIVKACVLFYKPAHPPPDWDQDDLSGLARALPGVTVHEDIDGMEAVRFGARTSGHTLVYDLQGKLQFSGGITRARGQAGVNAGRQIVLSVLNQTNTTETKTPIFGCPLTTRRTTDRKGEPCRN